MKSKKKHLLVTGPPRSGTTPMFNMLTACLPWAHGDKEAPASQDMQRKGNRISKRPLDLMAKEAIWERKLKEDAELCTVIMVRDPRDIICSQHHNFPGAYFVGLDGGYLERGKGRWVHDGPGLMEYFRHIQAWGRDGRFTTCVVKYEDLVTRPSWVQKMLTLAFNLEGEWDAKFASFDRRTTRHAMQDPKANGGLTNQQIGKWKLPEHRSRLASQIEDREDFMKLVEKLGYEKDNAWAEEIFSHAV